MKDLLPSHVRTRGIDEVFMNISILMPCLLGQVSTVDMQSIYNSYDK